MSRVDSDRSSKPACFEQISDYDSAQLSGGICIRRERIRGRFRCTLRAKGDTLVVILPGVD